VFEIQLKLLADESIAGILPEQIIGRETPCIELKNIFNPPINVGKRYWPI